MDQPNIDERNSFDVRVLCFLENGKRAIVVIKRFLFLTQRVVNQAYVVEGRGFARTITDRAYERKRVGVVIERFLFVAQKIMDLESDSFSPFVTNASPKRGGRCKFFDSFALRNGRAFRQKLSAFSKDLLRGSDSAVFLERSSNGRERTSEIYRC